MRALSILALALPGLMASFSLQAEQKPATTAQANEFPKLYTVETQTRTNIIQVAGTVAARKSVRLAAQAPGRVKSLAGGEGDRFEQEAELAKIDDKALRAKLSSAKAQREAALASIRNANVQLNRELYSPRSGSSGSAPGGMGMPAMMDQMFTNPMQSMMGMRNRGAERGSDLVQRETAITQAQIQLRQADAQIEEIQASLRDVISIAPFSGVIEKLYVEVGDTVQPGQPLLDFSETTGFQIKTDVPVRLRPGLLEGEGVSVLLDGAKEPVRAVISRIFPVADSEDHTVRVELDLPKGTRATVGMYAEVSVPDKAAGRINQLVIPKSAVITQGGLPLVFAVGSDGKTKLRSVRLGDQFDEQRIAVLSGVNKGDRVVAEPAPGLRSGQVVVPTTARLQE